MVYNFCHRPVSRVLASAIMAFSVRILQGQPAPDVVVPPSVKALIEEVATNPGGCCPMGKEFSKLPRDEVIAAVVQALRMDGRFGDRAVRRTAYGLLKTTHAQAVPVGRSQLLKGLEEGDAMIPTICASALARGTDQDKSDTVAALVKAWDRSILEFGRPSKPVVESLGELGPSAQSCLERITQLLEDASADENIRLTAAHAMFSIELSDKTLAVVRRLDPIGERVAFWSLPRVIGEAQSGGKRPDEALRLQVRTWIIQGLQSDAAATRQAAFECLGVVVDVFIQGDSVTDYTVDPQLKTVLQHIADLDADAGLRERVAQFLARDLELIAQKVIKRRAQ